MSLPAAFCIWDPKKKKLNGNLFGKMPPIKKFIAKGRILGLTPKFRSLKSLVENWRVCFDVCPLQFWPNFAFVMIKTFKLQNSHTSSLSSLSVYFKAFLYWGRLGLVWIFMGDYKLYLIGTTGKKTTNAPDVISMVPLPVDSSRIMVFFMLTSNFLENSRLCVEKVTNFWKYPSN